MLTGGDLLNMIERLLGDTRKELGELDTRLLKTTAQLDDLKQRELGVLAVLARVRVREIESGNVGEALDNAGREVQQILAQRAQAQQALGGEIATAEGAHAQLGAERKAQQELVAAADASVDAAEAEAQKVLAADANYRARLDTATACDGVADLAKEKAQAAHSDRSEKGKPYEADRLFMYLWQRGYGTTQYRAGPFTRLLDGWVAGPETSHPLDNVLRNIRLLHEGDPDKQFGMTGLRTIEPDDVVTLVGDAAGFEPDRSARTGPVPIDPDRVLAACDAVGDRPPDT